MAYSTGSYTDCNDALDKAAAWAVTNGWTQNMNTLEDSSTRRRVHLYKSINGVDVYSNFKVCLNHNPFASYYNNVYGIGVQGSTGYDAGLAWNVQPGYPAGDYGTIGGCVDKLISTGGTYHFFATSTNLTCWFSTNSTYLDWRGFTIGTIAGCPLFFASGGSYQDDANYVNRSLLGAYGELFGANMGIYHGGYWYDSCVYSEFSHKLKNHMPIPGNPYNTTTDYAPEGSLVYYAPDSIRGNVVMAPIIPRAYVIDSTKIMTTGELEGIKMINTKNHANASEITVSGDTYMLFKQCNNTSKSPTYCGWAFKK